jgi:alanyl aminopeptidase
MMNCERIFGFLFLVGAVCCSTARTVSTEPSSPRPSPSQVSPTAPPKDPAETLAESQPPGLRLDGRARPKRYALDLTLVPSEDEFSGSVEIQLELSKPHRLLWLNATELQIRSATLRSGNELIGGRSVPGNSDFIGIAFDRPAPAGAATLRLEYSGKLSTRNSNGLFKQKEGDDWYAFTHFEPIDARRAFPCFDEPGFKVPWQITLHLPKDDVAVANAPAISETTDGQGLKTVQFAETRPLPSYLVAFAVGPFELVDAGKTSISGAPIRIITPRGRGAEAQYAAQVTPRIIAALEDYFGSPYPYEKLDQIALLQSGGAMENPGLVTYSQLLILIRPDQESLAQKRRYAHVCAHELAHQWFGDLVTMNWWDDTWLNEAFATWLADKIVNRLWPEWDNSLSVQQARSDVMSGDGLISARKIRQPIDSKHDIVNAFDQITYTKGGAVLATFENWVGEETFRRGVQRYLKDHAWGNATADDFVAAMSTESARDLATPFSTFLDQPGVPIVSISLKCRPGKPPKLVLAQQRYLPLGSKGSTHQTWQIPICARYGTDASATRQCFLLTTASAEVPLQSPVCPSWVMADAAAGYYRVALERELVAKLWAKRDRLSVRDRLAFFSDVQAAVHSGQMPAADALALIPSLVADGDRHLIGSAAGFLAGEGGSRARTAPSIGDYLVPGSKRSNFAQYLRRTFGRKARALGWNTRPGEDDETRLLRASLVGLVADLGEDRSLLAEARKLTHRWLRDRSGIEPEMVDAVLRAAAAHGDDALFDRFHQEAKKETRLRERTYLLRGMSSFRDPRIVERGLQIVLSGEFDAREATTLLFGQHKDPGTQLRVYQFVRQNFDALAAKLPRDTAARLPMVAVGLCDEARRDVMDHFFAGRSTKHTGGPRILSQALEQLSLCSAYRKAQQPSVAGFLSARAPNKAAEAAAPQ